MTSYADEIAKQVIDFQKGAFVSWYGAISSMQDQAASAADMMLNQTDWIPDEGRAIILSWFVACLNERDRLKVFLQDGYSQLEKYLAQQTAPVPARAQRSEVKEKTAAPEIKSKVAAVEQKVAAPAQETKPSAQSNLTSNGEIAHGSKAAIQADD